MKLKEREHLPGMTIDKVTLYHAEVQLQTMGYQNVCYLCDGTHLKNAEIPFDVGLDTTLSLLWNNILIKARPIKKKKRCICWEIISFSCLD